MIIVVVVISTSNHCFLQVNVIRKIRKINVIMQIMKISNNVIMIISPHGYPPCQDGCDGESLIFSLLPFNLIKTKCMSGMGD